MACGIGAVKIDSEEAFRILRGLGRAQNNRGDQSFGFGFLDGEELQVEKIVGSPDALYRDTVSSYGEKNLGLVHNRYATSGTVEEECAQPLLFDGVAVAHNGNISNVQHLEQFLPEQEYSSEVDTEVIGRILSEHQTLEEALSFLEQEAVGSFNLGMLTEDGDICLYRDSLGQHPLWYLEDEKGFYGMSETFAGNSIGKGGAEEVKPGELVVFGDEIEKQRIAESQLSFCPFEVYYFENPGSQHQDQYVKDLRKEIGRLEAKKDKGQYGEGIVVPVLSSGRHFASGYAEELDLDMEELIIKNRNFRNYMDPQERSAEAEMSRKQKAQLKHVPLEALEGERAILVDDSVVRGDTSRGITESLRALGAEEVHWKIMFPRIQNPCIFGLDHSEKENLIAVDKEGNLRSENMIAKEIGANSVNFGSKESFVKATGMEKEDVCWGCVDPVSEYPQQVPEEEIEKFEV